MCVCVCVCVPKNKYNFKSPTDELKRRRRNLKNKNKTLIRNVRRAFPLFSRIMLSFAHQANEGRVADVGVWLVFFYTNLKSWKKIRWKQKTKQKNRKRWLIFVVVSGLCVCVCVRCVCVWNGAPWGLIVVAFFLYYF